jgi:uncharacterized damage-inducible protein DinB
MAKLQPGTYAAYFQKYISLVDAETVTEAINKYSSSINVFFADIPEDKTEYKYAEDKWSVKELLQHVTDAERIFAYRALRIARQDKTPLPGFDENSYAAASNASQRDWKDLLEEFRAVRWSTDLLLQSFDENQLEQVGITNNNATSAKAIAFIIFGHLLHHKRILEERYLS